MVTYSLNPEPFTMFTTKLLAFIALELLWLTQLHPPGPIRDQTLSPGQLARSVRTQQSFDIQKLFVGIALLFESFLDELEIVKPLINLPVKAFGLIVLNFVASFFCLDVSLQPLLEQLRHDAFLDSFSTPLDLAIDITVSTVSMF